MREWQPHPLSLLLQKSRSDDRLDPASLPVKRRSWLTKTLRAKTTGTVEQNFGLPWRTARIFGMGQVGGNAAGRLQENGGRMFVSRDRVAKRDVAEILQSVGESVVLRVAGL